MLNLEIQGLHTYTVSTLGVVVPNNWLRGPGAVVGRHIMFACVLCKPLFGRPAVGDRGFEFSFQPSYCRFGPGS